ncbi:class I SAM-dependent methyltransferase [Thermosulfuriphilus sp.]
MVHLDPLSAGFWRDYFGRKTDWSLIRRGFEAKRWDFIARSYQEFVSSTTYGQMVRKVVSGLERKGALGLEKTVLDIGSGPGTFGLLMAPKVKEVTCLDISAAMIEELRNRAAAQGLRNIRAICEDWFSFEPEQAFDLVFCSMSPVLDELGGLDKMLRSSRRYVSLVYWAGPYENELFLRLYRRATGEDLRWFSSNAVTLFNYLYGLGYLPEITFFNETWELKLSEEEGISYLLWSLSFYKEPTETDALIARELVRERLRAGYFKDVTRTKLAFIFLDKKLC